MKKAMIKEIVNFEFNWTYGVEIKKLKSDLEELEKLGATTIDIELDESYGNTSIKIEAFLEREETEKECKIRIDNFNRYIENTVRRELEEYERLKLKLGK